VDRRDGFGVVDVPQGRVVAAQIQSGRDQPCAHGGVEDQGPAIHAVEDSRAHASSHGSPPGKGIGPAGFK